MGGIEIGFNADGEGSNNLINYLDAEWCTNEQVTSAISSDEVTRSDEPFENKLYDPGVLGGMAVLGILDTGPLRLNRRKGGL